MLTHTQTAVTELSVIGPQTQILQVRSGQEGGGGGMGADA